jgi:hypothetical protein
LSYLAPSSNHAMEPTPPDLPMSLFALQTLNLQPAGLSAAWLILFSLDVWQAQSRAGVYAEASAIVYTLGQSGGVTAIAKIAGGLLLLRM